MADAVFTYDKVFSDKHTLNAMIGMNYTQDDTYKLKGTGSGSPYGLCTYVGAYQARFTAYHFLFG